MNQVPFNAKQFYSQKAQQYMEQNLSTARICETAAYIGINRSYLSYVFKSEYGISPREYLLGLRMEQGCNLLRNTNTSITEIAQSIGYENPLTFSKCFKNVYGICPREYRNRNRIGR